jgi:hypothetical protein
MVLHTMGFTHRDRFHTVFHASHTLIYTHSTCARLSHELHMRSMDSHITRSDHQPVNGSSFNGPLLAQFSGKLVDLFLEAYFLAQFERRIVDPIHRPSIDPTPPPPTTVFAVIGHHLCHHLSSFPLLLAIISILFTLPWRVSQPPSQPTGQPTSPPIWVSSKSTSKSIHWSNLQVHPFKLVLSQPMNQHFRQLGLKETKNKK